MAVFLGVALVAGGHDRFASRGFANARQVPGQHVTWGAVVVAAGLCMLVGSPRQLRPLLQAATFAVVIWCSFFAITLAASVLQDDKATQTGWITYGGWSALGLLLFASLWTERDR